MSKLSQSPEGARRDRAAIYTRVSTERQAEHGLSLEAQRERCLGEIAHRAWEPVGEFIERGVSGASDSRPELNRVLLAAERGAFERLVIPKLDRLGRSARFLHEVHERLRAAGVELVSVADGIDAASPYGRAQLGMLAVFAEFEREMISERVSSVQAERRNKGLHNGPAAFGYRSENGKWQPERAEADVVRRIFAEWLGGTSQYAITQALNRDGVRPRRGREWTQGTIARLLRNPAYGTPCPCGHDPLVATHVFEQARALLGGRHRGGGPNRRTATGHLFLNGFLRCGLCGSPLGPRTDKRRGYEVYKCQRSRNHGAGACPMPVVQREALERDLVEHFMQTDLDVQAMREQHAEELTRRLTEVEGRRAEASRAEGLASARLRRVRRHYQDGQIDAAEWADHRDELEEERRGAAGEVTRLSKQEEELRDMASGRDTEEEVLRFLASVKREVLSPVRDAETLDALRAGFRRIYKCFHVYPAGSEGAVGLAGELGERKQILAPTGADGVFLGPAYGDLRATLSIPADSYAGSLTT